MKDFLDISYRLKVLRGNLSQRAFAEKVGVPLRSYERYEAGHRMPPYEVLIKVAAVTDSPIEELIRGESFHQADCRQFAARLVKAGSPRIAVDDDLNVYVVTLRKGVKKPKLLNKMVPEVFERFMRILEEGDKEKINAIRSQLKALDPKKEIS
jgi:transcriptional regulator with XRE-family HTH domain